MDGKEGEKVKFKCRNKEIDAILRGDYPGYGMLLMNGKRTVRHLKLLKPPPDFPDDLPISGHFDKRMGRTFRYFKSDGKYWFSTGFRTIQLDNDMSASYHSNILLIFFSLKKGNKRLFTGIFFNRDFLDLYDRWVYSEPCHMNFFQTVSLSVNHQHAGLNHPATVRDYFGPSWQRQPKPKGQNLLKQRPKDKLEENKNISSPPELEYRPSETILRRLKIFFRLSKKQ